MGRLTERSDALGQRVRYTYDANGNRTQTELRDPSGVLVSRSEQQYDVRDRAVASVQFNGETDPNPITQHHQWDANGNLTQSIDANAQVTEHRYDAADRLTESVDALNGTVAYVFDELDRTSQITAPNGAQRNNGVRVSYVMLTLLFSRRFLWRAYLVYPQSICRSILSSEATTAKSALPANINRRITGSE